MANVVKRAVGVDPIGHRDKAGMNQKETSIQHRG
jgi:hypothetical protein